MHPKAPFLPRRPWAGLGRASLAGAQALAALLLAAAAAIAQAQPEARFRDSTTAVPAGLGLGVLDERERAFIATLPEVRVAVAHPSFRPYEVIGDNGEVTGIHVDMLVELARAFGIRMRPVVFASWSESLEAARRREVDLLISVGVDAARSEFLTYTLGTTPMVSARFGPIGSVAPDPERARYVVAASNIAQAHLQRRYPQASVRSAADTDHALALVRSGDADYYVGTLLPTLDRLAREGGGGLEVKELLQYGSGHFHFAVRKDWAPLAGILNRGLSVLRQGASPALAHARGPGMAALGQPSTARVPDTAQLEVLLRHPVWRVGAVRGLRLLNDVDEQGTHQGIGAEYAEAVARTWGVGLQVMPFDSVADMLAALEQGRIDLVPFLTRTPERERRLAYSRPYVDMPYTIVARSDAPMYWGLDSLRGRRLALAPQHPLRELLRARWPDIHVVDAPSGDGAMTAVVEGRADAAIEVKLFANLRINAPDGDTLRVTAVVPELPSAFHMATGERTRELVPLLDVALDAIPEAERRRMQRRWVALDLSPPFPWRRHLPWMATAATAVLALALATALWMRRLRREVAARRRTEAQLSDLTATLPCVAFRSLHADDGRLLGSFCSAGAERVLGFVPDPAATLLQALEPQLADAERTRVREGARSALALGQDLHLNAAYAHPDGRARWLQIEAVVRHHAGGQRSLTGYVADVSTERELSQRIVQEAEARHLMLASASHELRAPTHVLGLALQAMAQHLPGTQAADQVRVARDAVRTLAQLLEDLLDAARLDRHDFPYRPQGFDPRALLDEVAASTAAWAADKGLQFTLEADAALPQSVLLDPLRVRQVLANLLANAVRATSSGQVRLLARLQAGTPRRLLLQVVDSGRGIEPERLRTLFTPYRAGGAAAGSSGLGLSICRRLVQRMGGSLDLDSRPGQGTTASVTLPLPEFDRQPCRGVVLVCDDDDTSRLLAAQLLLAAGHEVAEAADGAAAYERWRAGGVAALCSDLDMPVLGGAELLRRIHAAQAGLAPAQRTRLVLCSGHGSPETADGALPFDACLVKPIELGALRHTLAALGVAPHAAAAQPQAPLRT